MDEWILAIVQGLPFDSAAFVLLAAALLLAAFLVHALVTGRTGSGEDAIVRAEDPRRFWRSIGTGAAYILVLLALVAYGLSHRDSLETGFRLAMPLIFLLMLATALYRGDAFSWSRAEQPWLFWCGIALMAAAVALTLGPSLDELGPLL
ncbi:MAG TPA: hypothetical protein VF693_07335 [Allosphingosinicella sp.]|jgi:hypothetical protein